MFNPVVVLDAATVSSAGLTKDLPPALQKAAQVVFVFGSSFKYNRSNLYLAAFNASDVEAGPSKWFYYAGQNGGANSWSNDEKSAAPLLAGSPNVGNHSVVWNAALHRFILMYGNVQAQVSTTPWGPWSAPMVVLGPRSPWADKLIHHPGQDPDCMQRGSHHGPAGTGAGPFTKEANGVPYGPYLINQSTTNGDGSVTVYFTMSTWSPYEVFLVSTTFKAGVSQTAGSYLTNRTYQGQLPARIQLPTPPRFSISNYKEGRAGRFLPRGLCRERISRYGLIAVYKSCIRKVR